MNEAKLNLLKQKVALAASAYWDEHSAQHGKQDNAILWLRNDITEEMLCLTKGGYTEEIAQFIKGLNQKSPVLS